MNPDTEPTPLAPTRESISKATSELNNLLQIIAGTSAEIENVWQGTEGAEKYLAMLRTSIERAEKVAADLAQQAGGTDQKMMSAEGAISKSKSSDDASAPKQSLLLVDDEEMALTLMKRILSDAGFNVATAHSGFACLDLFRKRPYAFDLILLDLTMPFMDGEETFMRLRDIRSDVPVVLCTGFILQERLNRLMGSGLAGFLRKPISPDEIVGLVRSTLANAKYSRGNTNPGGVPMLG